ncbi:hypothetical protein A2U01_0021444 [Trifolium medium]|uniref:Uncharacterized protein n=1 Tax=Trifolium medium TaxID=97028 RepID=A0A392NMW1_9FABA|nr:hypothetical protein [Trifolium medium]
MVGVGSISRLSIYPPSIYITLLIVSPKSNIFRYLQVRVTTLLLLRLAEDYVVELPQYVTTLFSRVVNPSIELRISCETVAYIHCNTTTSGRLLRLVSLFLAAVAA